MSDASCAIQYYFLPKSVGIAKFVHYIGIPPCCIGHQKCCQCYLLEYAIDYLLDSCQVLRLLYHTTQSLQARSYHAFKYFKKLRAEWHQNEDIRRYSWQVPFVKMALSHKIDKAIKIRSHALE